MATFLSDLEPASERARRRLEGLAAGVPEEREPGQFLRQLVESQPKPAPTGGGGGGGGPIPGGPGGMWEKLRQGFIAAGRSDLAQMVDDPDFRLWVGNEGLSIPKGWSQNFPGHGRNYGVFQLWEGHPWIDVGDRPGLRRQAFLAASKFDLDPQDIDRYADQIRAGSYQGWG